MKGSLIVVRGGNGEPRVLLTMEDDLSRAAQERLLEHVIEWWGGQHLVAIMGNVTLSVVDIDLDKGISIVSPP